MIRPYRFEGLRKFTKEQVALQDSVSRYISSRPFTHDFRQSLGTIIGQYLKVACDIGPAEICPMSAADVARLVPQTTCIAIVGVAPHDHKIILQLDGDMVAYAIERLLGGDGEQGRLLRPLTDIEEGILSFLLLTVLHTFQSGLTSGHELALTLDGFAADVSGVQTHLQAAAMFYGITSRITVGTRLGYGRIFVPQSLIKTVAHTWAPTPEQELRRMRQALHTIGEYGIEARIEAARTDLSQADLARLEPGDIILLEDHQLHKTPDGVAGEIAIRLGAGENGGLRGRLINHDDHCRCQITDIVIQEPPNVEDR